MEENPNFLLEFKEINFLTFKIGIISNLNLLIIDINP
jgi:hypothetical protein